MHPVVPRALARTQGKELFAKGAAFLAQAQECHAAQGEFSETIDDAFEEQLQPLRELFTQRVRLYEQAWGNQTALRQAEALIAALSKVYRELYDPIFAQQRVSDNKGFAAFQDCANAYSAEMKKRMLTCVQSATNLAVMYQHALTV